MNERGHFDEFGQWVAWPDPDDPVTATGDGAGDNGDGFIPPPIEKESGGKNLPPPDSLEFRPLASLLADVPEEPAWVLRGYLARFALTLLAGRPKAGKSTLAFALMAAFEQGAAFCGIETAPSGVLLLSEERRDTLAEKAAAFGLHSFRHAQSLGTDEKKKVDVLLRHEARSTTWPETVKQAIAHCHAHGLGVLVVDTWDRWTQLRGDSENAAGAVNEALEPLQYAAASGLAVVVVTHQRKSSGEFGEAVRGSNALTGGVDVVVELERPQASLALSKHVRVLRAVSRFNSTPEEFYVELGDNGYTAVDDPAEVKVQAERAEVLEAVRAAGEPMTSRQIAEDLEKQEASVRRYLNDLLEREAVTREGKGVKGNPHRWRLARDEA